MSVDYAAQIAAKRADRAKLLAQAEQLVAEGKYNELDAVTAQVEDAAKAITALERAASASNDEAMEPAYDGVLHSGGAKKPGDGKDIHFFGSLGEQLQAVANAKTSGVVDDRLQKIQNALGANEGTGADGGFLLQPDFAGKIMESAVQNSPLLNRLDRYTCSAASNSMRWLGVDETDVSASVFGGVQMYWAAEAASVAASKPKFKELKLDLEKMMGFAYCTDEMLQDVPFMNSFFSHAFSLAADRLLTDSVISGDGNGKPLGIVNSKGLITVEKVTGQATGSFVGKNAIQMQTRILPRSRKNLVWLMHPDVEEQLPELTIGEGSASRLLWTPEGGLGNFDTQRILNKPVLFEDSCSGVGTKGDIMLVDPTAYILLSKGTAKQDWSIHVEFLTDQRCFRMVYRCNGKPKSETVVKLKNSKIDRGSFVALADRK